MSIDTYIIRADHKDLNGLTETELRNKRTGLALNDLDPTTLIKLESLITGEDTFIINNRGYDILASKKGLVYIKTSPQLLKALRKLTFKEKNEILNLWIDSKEMSLYNSSPIKAAEILDWLIQSARSVEDLDKPLIICMSRGSH